MISLSSALWEMLTQPSPHFHRGRGHEDYVHNVNTWDLQDHTRYKVLGSLAPLPPLPPPFLDRERCEEQAAEKKAASYCRLVATRWRCRRASRKISSWLFPDPAANKPRRAPLVSPSIPTTYHQPLWMDMCPPPGPPVLFLSPQPSLSTLKHPLSQGGQTGIS